MTEARAVVQRRADQARALLAAMPDIPARRALQGLCELVVTRSS
jgi:heptaprenyl diphosphate synthase